GVGQDVDETFGGEVHLGAGIGGEGKLSDVVADISGLELLLGFADRSDFRISVNHVRNDVVVHVSSLAGENFGDRDAFLLGLVRQHRAGDDIADGIDAGDV